MKPARTPSFDIVTVGAATRDVFVRSSHFDQVRNKNAPDGLDACLPLGAKIPIDELTFQTGGGGVNAAVTFSRFGLRTACVTRIGHDVGGQEILNVLKRERINADGLAVDPKHATGYSVILLSGAGHRAILTARGAAEHFEQQAFNWNKTPSAWIYLTSVGGSLKALKNIFQHAKQSVTHVAWNPGSREIELGLKTLQSFFLHTDILIFNKEEAAAVADCSPRDLPCIFHTLGPLPRHALVVTDGQHGAYVYARGTIWHAPILPAKAINTTGAGDAFGSAFVATIIQNGDLQRALQAATLNATNVIRHMGATAGILPTAPTAAACRRVKTREVTL